MGKFDHIDKIADKVIETFENHDRCCIISATGTGKSWMIKSTIERMKPKKTLILSARNALLDQFREKYRFGNMNILYLKYTDIVRKFKSGDADDLLNLELIVCDEAHLVGAKNTSVYFEKMVRDNKGVKILGATATPQRSDDLTDDTVVDHFFDGNRIAEISLKEAIACGLLPMPTYVASLYTLNEELEDRLLRVRDDESLDDEVRDYLMTSLDQIKVDWESMNSLGQTFFKFISPIAKRKNSAKILVFCENMAHLKSVRKNLDHRFKNAFYPLTVEINEYTSHSRNEIAFEKFIDETPKDGLCQVLYVIDCFNVGQHVNDLDCCILLRKTQSQIIYLQQVGRALGVNGNPHPLIIDLVNNCKNVANYQMWKELQEAYDNGEIGNSEYYDHSEYREHEKEDHEVFFYNYVEDAEKIFEQIDFNIQEKTYEYDGEFKTLVDFCLQYGKDSADVRLKLKQGLSFKDALELALNRDDYIYQYKGQNGTLRLLCKRFKKNFALVQYRINNGQTLEEAMR